MQFTDTSEKGFQKFIIKELTTNSGYVESVSNDFDKEFCINKGQLLLFIEQTQPEKYEMLQRKGERAFLVRLDEKIKKLGVIEVLRKGVKHFDKTINLFYRKPSSIYNLNDSKKYDANIFSVTQELAYSSDNKNRLDLCLFLNGIPVITTELKNPLSGQTVHNGIRQYKNDRDPKEKIFSFARCMVHFVADTELVYMTTELKRENSFFMPFNKGLNDGLSNGNFGAGNPVNPNGLKTHYFWEEVLSKQSIANIIDKFPLHHCKSPKQRCLFYLVYMPCLSEKALVRLAHQPIFYLHTSYAIKVGQTQFDIYSLQLRNDIHFS